MQLQPQHPFVSAKLTSAVDSWEVQALLAHFRACGGRVRSTSNYSQLTKARRQGSNTTVDGTLSSAIDRQISWPDALDPANHQRLSVLLCSYSHESPGFRIINPW